MGAAVRKARRGKREHLGTPERCRVLECSLEQVETEMGDRDGEGR